MINMSINGIQHEVYYGKTDATNNHEIINISRPIEMSQRKKN